MGHLIRTTIFAFLGFTSTGFAAQEFADPVEHKFADSDGVSIHYAKAGSGPLAVSFMAFQISGIPGDIIWRCCPQLTRL
jgi:hypothetical protein